MNRTTLSRLTFLLGGIFLLWLAGPAFSLAPLAWFALVPWWRVINEQTSSWKSDLVVWFAFAIYFIVSLEGIRHAHPAMYGFWWLLAVYLAFYPFAATRLARYLKPSFGLLVSGLVSWSAMELLRAYALTGISVLTLATTQTPLPMMTQLADIGGITLAGLPVLLLNFIGYELFSKWRQTEVQSSRLNIVAALLLIALSLGYSFIRTRRSEGTELASFALVQRSEAIDYGLDPARQREIFASYAQQSIDFINAQSEPVDAIVWPESMASGGLLWMSIADDFQVPEVLATTMSAEDFANEVQRTQEFATNQVRAFNQAIQHETKPHWVMGSGHQRFAKESQVHSALLHFGQEAELATKYHKRHLVMFGEYVPLIPSIPFLKELIPPGLGVTPGESPVRFDIANTLVDANICIETAVERVPRRHLSAAGLPCADILLTVTNDGWFETSNMAEHHLRIAQLVAVGNRTPILSAANYGPTAWIDDLGIVRKRLPIGTNETLLVRPKKSTLSSPYQVVGDWPMTIFLSSTIGYSIIRNRRSLANAT
ncbi:MAG: apolipoprotein N-acyltransferase [Planctomycetota bacterium]